MCRYQKRQRGEGDNLLRKGLLACWHAMRYRALNRDGHHPTYAEVSIDPRWSTFDGFIANQPGGQQYEIGLCLTRKGDIGNYSPENCSWQGKAANAREMHERGRMIRLSDGRLGLDVARSNGISDTLFRTRVSTHGWDPDEAATRPVAAYRKKESARV